MALVTALLLCAACRRTHKLYMYVQDYNLNMIGRADRTDGEGKHSLQSVVFRGWLVVWGCLLSLALNHSITLVHGALAPPPSLSLLSRTRRCCANLRVWLFVLLHVSPSFVLNFKVLKFKQSRIP